MNVKPYPKYKPSGVEWLGDVPEHWELWKVAHGFDLIGSGTTPPSDQSEWYDGGIPWITTGELRENIIFDTEKKVTDEAIRNFSALKIFPRESLAIAMYGATIGRLGILGVNATTNQACCVLYGGEIFDIKFVFYWLQAFKETIILLASGGGQPNISQDKIRSVKISCPSIGEQQPIVEYLDRETGRIDDLIAKKERLIELLQDKRTALISRAVTKGLNPNVRFKPSGVEWLGDVPEHWKVKRLKYLAHLQTGNTPSKSDDDNYSDDGLLWVKPDNLSEFVPINETKESLSDKGLSLARSVPAYSPLVCCIGTIGKFGYSEYRVATNQQINAVVYSEKVFVKYGLYLIAVSEKEHLRYANTNVVAILNADNQKQICYPLPPYDEQRAIVDFLNRETGIIDALTSRVLTAVEELKKYRTAIISAAVTGKIDVREGAK